MKRFIQKSIATLAMLTLIIASVVLLSPTNVFAANTEFAEILSTRHIFDSDSTGDYITGNHTCSTFDTPSTNESLSYGMSYYLDSKSANTTYNLYIYYANGTYFGVRPLTKNYSSASDVLNLANNTSYYFVVVPSNANTSYSFSYNLYYYK